MGSAAGESETWEREAFGGGRTSEESKNPAPSQARVLQFLVVCPPLRVRYGIFVA
jgi:hypothetical protein